MLNGLWVFMMAVGIMWAAVQGNLGAVTSGALDAAGEAVSLCITMLGVMAFWSGILEVGRRAGLTTQLSGKMRPILGALFPGIPKDHPALELISVNMIANMLGLGWAATPAGLQAMEELERLEEERREKKIGGAFRRGTASDEMCTFLVINISSLQLIPINMIAYRTQYGSADPMAVIGPALAATAVSTTVGVIACRALGRKKR